RSWIFKIPILNSLELSIAPSAVVTGRQLQDLVEHRQRIGNPKKSQIAIKRSSVESTRRIGQPKKSLHLGSKRKPIALIAVVDRLYSKVTPRKNKLLLPVIPNPKGEHAVQPANTIHAVLAIKIKDHFGVGSRTKHAAPCFKLASQRRLVIDLAVVGYR